MSKSAMRSRVKNEKAPALERVFEAPRELDFKAFSDPERLKRGPVGLLQGMTETGTIWSAATAK